MDVLPNTELSDGLSEMMANSGKVQLYHSNDSVADGSPQTHPHMKTPMKNNTTHRTNVTK